MFPTKFNNKSDLQTLKKLLNESCITKENKILLMKKELLQSKSKELTLRYHNLEREFKKEEDECCYIKNSNKNIKRLEFQRDLAYQIEGKKIKKVEKEAEDLLESLTLGAKDEEFRKELKESREQNGGKSIENDIAENQKCILQTKQLKKQMEDEREKVRESTDQFLIELKKTREKCREEEQKKRLLEKERVKIDILSNVSVLKKLKENYKQLRIESDCYLKEEEDVKKRLIHQERLKKQEENLHSERNFQLREKEKKRDEEEVREKEYLNLLTELMAEQEKFDHLRTEDRILKRNQHCVAAQKILEERRKRRNVMQNQVDEMRKTENNAQKLRELIQEEEERSLLLKYLPHIGRNLSSQVIRRLSLL